MTGNDDDDFDAKLSASIHPFSPKRANGTTRPASLTLHYSKQALRPLPANTIVRGILYRGSVTLFYGPPKGGKSFLVTDLALSVTERDGRDSGEWMGLGVTRHGPVLYVACEGHAGFWKRLRAAALHRGWSDDQFPDQFVLAIGRPALITPDDTRSFVPDPSAILEAVREMQRNNRMPVAVIVDTVFRSFGGGNVNASDHMNAYLAALAHIADLGIAVAAVHHEIKAGGSPAGSVSLIGAADSVIHVWCDEHGKHWWQIEYAKDDADTEPVAFDLTVVELGTDPDGYPASSCVVTSDQHTKAMPKPKHLRSAAASVGLRALAIALSRAGALLPNTPDFPPNTLAVAIEDWRAEFYSLKGGSPDNNRQAFGRAQDTLLAHYAITQKDGFVWKVTQN